MATASEHHYVRFHVAPDAAGGCADRDRNSAAERLGGREAAPRPPRLARFHGPGSIGQAFGGDQTSIVGVFMTGPLDVAEIIGNQLARCADFGYGLSLPRVSFRSEYLPQTAPFSVSPEPLLHAWRLKVKAGA
jgi:hypothetical protein